MGIHKIIILPFLFYFLCSCSLKLSSNDLQVIKKKRIFKVKVVKINPKIDREKRLASADYGSWLLNNKVL